MNGKKIFVTGSSGMLGSNLLELLKYDDIVGCSDDFDITDIICVKKTLDKIQPNIIIHSAAYTDVDGCEKDIDKAYMVNTIGTQNLVNCCIGKDIFFIYISSTGVYGDLKNEPYTEFDTVNPPTVHHKSKYEAEKVVQNHLSDFLILRTGWLYGGTDAHKKNFVYQRFLEASGKDFIYSDDTQIGNPTFVGDLIKQIELLIDTEQKGIFNCVNEAKNISRYDYVKKIVELFGLRCYVKAAPKGMFKRVAPVSSNESAVNYKLNLLGLNVMGNWEVVLKSYVKKLKSRI